MNHYDSLPVCLTCPEERPWFSCLISTRTPETQPFTSERTLENLTSFCCDQLTVTQENRIRTSLIDEGGDDDDGGGVAVGASVAGYVAVSAVRRLGRPLLRGRVSIPGEAWPSTKVFHCAPSPQGVRVCREGVGGGHDQGQGQKGEKGGGQGQGGGR